MRCLMRDEDLVFYDIEVFRWDSLVILKDINNKILGIFWNDISRRDAEMSGGKYLDFPTGFEGIEPIVKDKILVGYNNYHYDDLILTYMRNGVRARCDLIYGLNNTIISGHNSGVKADFKSLDTMQQIDISVPSLKLIEGNMGKNIKETDVAFTIDRPLTPEERKLTEEYCSVDVENTIEVYKLRKKSYFDVKESLVKMLDEKNPLKMKEVKKDIARVKTVIRENELKAQA